MLMRHCLSGSLPLLSVKDVSSQMTAKLRRRHTLLCCCDFRHPIQPCMTCQPVHVRIRTHNAPPRMECYLLAVEVAIGNHLVPAADITPTSTETATKDRVITLRQGILRSQQWVLVIRQMRLETLQYWFYPHLTKTYCICC